MRSGSPCGRRGAAEAASTIRGLASAGLCGGTVARTGAAARSEGRVPRCAEDITEKCVWLVCPRRARSLRAVGAGQSGPDALEGARARFGLGRAAGWRLVGRWRPAEQPFMTAIITLEDHPLSRPRDAQEQRRSKLGTVAE